VAVAPAAHPAQPAITDEVALAQRWREISIILRRQFDASWALSDFSHYLSNLGSYRIDSITADEIALTLEYVVQEISPNGGPGFPRPRKSQIRFRNRAPDYRILQWGKAVAESRLVDKAQFDIHWEQVRDRIMAQYDRDIAIADGAFDMSDLTAYRLERIDGEEIELRVDYTANLIASASSQPETRTARIRLRNRAPDYRILQWGNLPPLAAGDDGSARGRLVFRDAEEARQFSPILRRAMERQYAAGIRFRPTEAVSAADSGPPDTMHVKRHEVIALQSGQLTITVTYEVSTGGAAQRDRQATITLRNEGPAFKIVSWQRQ
jgi:hypothetical protein